MRIPSESDLKTYSIWEGRHHHRHYLIVDAYSRKTSSESYFYSIFPLWRFPEVAALWTMTSRVSSNWRRTLEHFNGSSSCWCYTTWDGDDRRVKISFKMQVYKWFVSFGIHLIGVIDLEDSDSVWHISLNVIWTFVSRSQRDFKVAFLL